MGRRLGRMSAPMAEGGVSRCECSAACGCCVSLRKVRTDWMSTYDRQLRFPGANLRPPFSNVFPGESFLVPCEEALVGVPELWDLHLSSLDAMFYSGLVNIQSLELFSPASLSGAMVDTRNCCEFSICHASKRTEAILFSFSYIPL